jgi:hypothetical protein
MNCVVCGTEVPHRLVGAGGGMNPWCSEPCGAKWRTRNNFLFDLGKQKTITGEQVLGLVIQKGFLDDNVTALTRLNQVSQTIRPLAKEHELGSAFHKQAVHQQQKGTRTETSYKTSQQKTGKKIQIQKQDVKGRTFLRTVDETREVRTPVHRQVPNIVKVDITPDKMMEIALMAYNTAVELKRKQLPVILYRVDSKGQLTSQEKKAQTLSSSVHAAVGDTEVWPLEKTAAWIQGAIRARVSFVLLNDPRGVDILIGGINKKSDAVYVRELHQITSMRYQIDVTTTEERPSGMKGKKLFILRPPARDVGVLPLVPRLTPEMWSHTWDSSKSNLSLSDSEGLIRDHLRNLFTEAGGKSELDLPMY